MGRRPTGNRRKKRRSHDRRWDECCRPLVRGGGDGGGRGGGCGHGQGGEGRMCVGDGQGQGCGHVFVLHAHLIYN